MNKQKSNHLFLQVLESSVPNAKFELELESMPVFRVFSLFSEIAKRFSDFETIGTHYN